MTISNIKVYQKIWGNTWLSILMITPVPYCGWLRNPAPVENGGKHPIVHRVSTIPGGAGFLPPTMARCLGPKAPCLGPKMIPRLQAGPHRGTCTTRKTRESWDIHREKKLNMGYEYMVIYTYIYTYIYIYIIYIYIYVIHCWISSFSLLDLPDNIIYIYIHSTSGKSKKNGI